VLSRHHPDQIVAVRIGNAGGVVVGLGQGENFLASDMPAILEHTREMIFLESRQMAVLRADGVTLTTLDGAPVTPQVHHVAWDPVGAAKGEYKHFMQKEIFDQPRALTDTLGGRIDFEHGRVMLPELNLTAERARSLTRLVTVACGTSYYSGLAGKFYIERLARLPVEVDYASEYRYRDPILDAETAVLAITQSGETADTLAAMEVVLGQPAESRPPLWSIVNALGSQAMRISDGCLAMHAGPEIGVASTKAFTASLIDQLLLAIYLGQLRGTLSPDAARRCTGDLARLPALVGRALEADAQVEALAGALYHYRDFLFLGRGIQYPIALEGALKLKEVSYIHAEGYPAGEMKHGPIALIDEDMPVVAIAPRDGLYDKMRSQIAQAKARGARVIAIATEGDADIAAEADHVLYIPDAPELLTPALTVIPLQLLAYHIAAWRGADVDQPRNLAKSVTVE
jgi:glucosamine--fructose-6-phosphate aminotransferase (isomerizing)